MRAIRVRKKGHGTKVAAHWLTDDELTRCGLEVDTLDVVEDLELESLPAVEACGNCARFVEGWKKPKPTVPLEEAWYRHALPASKGRISRTGPLRQSGRSGHGHRLL